MNSNLRVQYSVYSLTKKNKLNAHDQTLVQDGALIKVIDQEGYWGVADLTTWPTLGDQTWQNEISQQGKLFQRAIELATEDLIARKEKRSLLYNKWIKNNILVTDYKNFNFNDNQYTGQTFKIKGDRDIQGLALVLNQISNDIKIRIDFNACLNSEELRKFISSISHLKSKIEYIEDPTLYDLKLWSDINQLVPLAQDFVQAKDGYTFTITKPSREDVSHNKNTIMTSSMGHPVGLAHDLRIAQKIEQAHTQAVSGLLTLDLFEDTNFHQYFEVKNLSEINFSKKAINDFGIGMTDELNRLVWIDINRQDIVFQTNYPNQLLLNPRLNEAEKNILFQLKNKFEELNSRQNYFFIASSGSTKAQNESVKLLALHVNSVLNSAKRFNNYFAATQSDHWGLVLPTFHVAGLSILARSFLAKSQVFTQSAWLPQEVESWLLKNDIKFLSLVPAQVYDLVQLKVKPPNEFKKVFVGAGSLNDSVKSEFVNLGWPLVETYGMTETSSMIAVKEESADYFKVLPGVDVAVENNKLIIRCDSLAEASIQKINETILVNTLISDEGFFKTEDQVQIHQIQNQPFIQFLGRASDYIKILGEGVSLTELRGHLDKVVLSHNLPLNKIFLLSVEDSRLENLLVLAVDKSVNNLLTESIVEKFNQVVRPYEKIQRLIYIDQLPLSELGKIKMQELKNLILQNMKRRSDDKKI